MSIFNKTIFAFLIIAFSGMSNAALITTNGNSVSFTYDDMLVGLFGTPSVVGDALKFNPASFNATAPLSGGINFTDSTLSITVSALSGYTLSTIGLLESGDYKLFGAGSMVTAQGKLTDSNSFQGTNSFSVDAMGTAGLTLADWSGSASLDYYPTVTSTTVSLNNFLFALSNVGQLALVDKFDVKLSAVSVPSAVPLPQAVWLFGAGLLGLLSVSKRKNFI